MSRMRTFLALAAAFALALCGALAGAGVAAGVAAAAPIEARYAAAGPWAVSSATVRDASGRAIYELRYPTDLGAGGVRHPIVTWGNRLDGDATARGAFVGSPPEIDGNPAWQDQAQRALP